MAYAEHTKVPFAKTVSDIIVMVRKAGAMQVGQMEEANRLTIMFTLADRHVRFRVAWENNERQQRQRARALLLVIKAKLESVESGVETFDEAFLPNIVVDGGATIYERVSGDLALEYQTGKPQLFLIAGPA